MQQALLKLVEGTIAAIPPQGGRKHPNQDYIQVDTTNILFICGGAFAGLEKVVEQRTEASGIGFNAVVRQKSGRDVTELFSEVEPDDIVKYGLIPELVGRLPVVASLAELDEDALVQILTQPKNALVKQYQRLLELDNAQLEFTEGALKAVAKKAMKRKTGARGLRSILEDLLIDTMYDLPSMEGVEKVVVEESTVLENKKPLMVHKQVEKRA